MAPPHCYLWNIFCARSMSPYANTTIRISPSAFCFSEGIVHWMEPSILLILHVRPMMAIFRMSSGCSSISKIIWRNAPAFAANSTYRPTRNSPKLKYRYKWFSSHLELAFRSSMIFDHIYTRMWGTSRSLPGLAFQVEVLPIHQRYTELGVFSIEPLSVDNMLWIKRYKT